VNLRFYEVQCFKTTMETWVGPVLGVEFVYRGFNVLKFAIKSLSALGDEIFRLTHDTRGGLLLILLIFFSAWVLGASIYVETNGLAVNCESVGSCTYNLMRLTFFDGNGLDLAYSLMAIPVAPNSEETKGKPILFFLCMLYMCLTAFGLINGLVGIFGSLFEKASEKAFEQEELAAKYGREKEVEESSSSSSDSSSEDDKDNHNKIGDGGERDEEADKTKVFEMAALPIGKHAISEDQRRSATDLMKAVHGEKAPMTETEMKETIYGIIGKEPRAIVLQEFQQEQNTPRLTSQPGSRPSSAVSRNINAVVSVVGGGGGGGIFNRSKIPSSGGLEGANTDAVVKQLREQISRMQNRIEHQSELMMNLVNTVTVLSQKLQEVHGIQPTVPPQLLPSSSLVGSSLRKSHGEAKKEEELYKKLFK
jgi:hypothetical protein